MQQGIEFCFTGLCVLITWSVDQGRSERETGLGEGSLAGYCVALIGLTGPLPIKKRVMLKGDDKKRKGIMTYIDSTGSWFISGKGLMS